MSSSGSRIATADNFFQGHFGPGHYLASTYCMSNQIGFILYTSYMAILYTHYLLYCDKIKPLKLPELTRLQFLAASLTLKYRCRGRDEI